MEAGTCLFPSKKHYGNKSAFHEEGEESFNGKRSTEYVAYKPGVVAPVGAKFKFQDDACCHSHGKVDAEK